MLTLERSPLASRLIAAFATLFVVSLALAGGSSRDDVFSYVFVQLAAGGLLMVLLVPSPKGMLRAGGRPLFIVGIIACLAIVQLIPLPWSIWSALPGREVYMTAGAIAGLGDVWRPISLAPDATADSMLFLLPIVATIFAIRLGGDRYTRYAIIGILVVAIASSLLATLQIGAGAGSGLRLYRHTSIDSGVGLLANRNHQATLLAMAIPAAVWWAIQQPSKTMGPTVRQVIGLAMVLLFVAGGVLTGSRIGLVTCAIGIFGGAFMAWPIIAKIPTKIRLWGLGASLVSIAGVLAVELPRHRVAEMSVSEDFRFTFWPRTIEMIGTFFPVGSGMGSFATVFPRFERIADLRPEYVNRAHNDFLEIGAEAGVFAYLLLAVFFLWFVRSTAIIWKAKRGADPNLSAGKLSTIMIFIAMIASVTDYPLRTSLIACIVTCAATILQRTAGKLKGTK